MCQGSVIRQVDNGACVFLDLKVSILLTALIITAIDTSYILPQFVKHFQVATGKFM